MILKVMMWGPFKCKRKKKFIKAVTKNFSFWKEWEEAGSNVDIEIYITNESKVFIFVEYSQTNLLSTYIECIANVLLDNLSSTFGLNDAECVVVEEKNAFHRVQFSVSL